MISTNSVVDSARGGDLFSFQALVERYQSPLYRFLYRLVADAELARDLTIDTFLLAHKKLNRVDKSIRFEAWLYRLGSGVAMSALRRQHLAELLLRRKRTMRLSPEDDLEAQTVQATLCLLPINALIPMLLRSLGGFSYEEIAQILHISQRDVGERIRQGRAFFRQHSQLLPRPSEPAANDDPACAAIEPLISAYLDHQLPGTDQAVVNARLATCSTCRAILADYQEIDRRLARLRTRGAVTPLAYEVTRILRGEKPVRAKPAAHSRRALLAGLMVIALVGLVGASILVASGAGRRGAPSGTGLLYVALQNSEGQVAVVDVAGARLVATIPIGARALRLAADRDGNHVYALGDDGILSVIDVAQNAVADRYLIGGRPGGMAISPDGKRLFVTLADRRTLMVFDTDSGRQTADIRVGRTPREVAVTPDGQWIYVFNAGDSTVSKIRSNSKQESKILRLIKVGDQITEFAAHPMAATPDGRKLYVADLTRERMWSVDVGTDDVQSFDVPLRDLGRDIVVAPAGDRLYVTHGDPRGARAALAGLASMALPAVERTAEIRGYFYGVTTSPDGSTLYASSPDDNAVIFADAQTLQTQATVQVGQRPSSIIYLARSK